MRPKHMREAIMKKYTTQAVEKGGGRVNQVWAITNTTY